jgi:hypothetical protein
MPSSPVRPRWQGAVQRPRGLLIADHMIVANERHRGRHDERVALIVHDDITEWLQLATGTKMALRTAIGFDYVINACFSDSAPELRNAAEHLSWVDAVGTPVNPKTTAS